MRFVIYSREVWTTARSVAPATHPTGRPSAVIGPEVRCRRWSR